ncbi:MAG TPA: ComEA family DNA-binding protein, partial [candidate division Zixibacteria bacterium]|nr:ComEA family DNA-binding protein [candidate division Zixibacteria bacterium]
KPAKININAADVEQLMKIPGIGRTLATLIVNQRRRHVKFTSFGQLLNVKGIGRKKLAKIKKMATL